MYGSVAECPSCLPVSRLKRASLHARMPAGWPSRSKPSGGRMESCEVLKSGIDTYTVTCVAPSRVGKLPDLAADQLRHARRRPRDHNHQDLAADLLQSAKDSTSPREIRRRWRERNYYP